MWWDGWWNSPADTPKKKLIESIFRYNPLAQDKSIQDKIKSWEQVLNIIQIN